MYADILILAHLVAGPRHGYEIKKSVARILGGGAGVNNNVLYPTLRRLEQQGAVVRTVKPQEGRPDRHVYRLTDRGRALLQERLRTFPPADAADAAEFRTRLTFFQLLDPPARRAILAARREALAGQGAALAGFLAEVDDQAEWRWARRVLAFQRGAVERELAWLMRSAGRWTREPRGPPGGPGRGGVEHRGGDS